MSPSTHFVRSELANVRPSRVEWLAMSEAWGGTRAMPSRMAERAGVRKFALTNPQKEARIRTTLQKSTGSGLPAFSDFFVRLPLFSDFASAMSLEMSLGAAAGVGSL